MKFRALFLWAVSGSVSMTALPAAHAHIQLHVPLARVANDDGIKDSPCGSERRNSTRVTTFKPGETIAVEWTETISHPGYFRIMLSESGDAFEKPSMDSFTTFSNYYNGQRNGTTQDKLPKEFVGAQKVGDNWLLADYWALHPSKPGVKQKYSLNVTLPKVSCTSCSLQLVQGMFESGRTYGNAYYYHCADLVLKGQPSDSPDAGIAPPADARPGAGGSGGGGAPASAGPSGGAGGAGAGGEGGSNSNDDDDRDSDEDDSSGAEEGNEAEKSSGCRMGGGGASGPGSAFFLLALLFFLVRCRAVPRLEVPSQSKHRRR